MTTPKADAEEVAQRLKSVVDYVRDCEIRVARGEVMDLQGLDRNVIEICDSIATLDEDEARVLEQKMSTLIEGLEELARAMKAQQDEIAAAEGSA